MKVIIAVSGSTFEYSIAKHAACLVSDQLSGLGIPNKIIYLDNINCIPKVINSMDYEDIVYIVSYGGMGENGMLQSLLEASGVAYTGCSPTVCAMCRDKYMFSKISELLRINIPRTFKIDGMCSVKEFNKKLNDYEITFPVIIKPRFLSGSSYGVRKIDSYDQFEKVLPNLLTIDPHLMVQKYIDGTDYISSVIFSENGYDIGVAKARINKDVNFEKRYKSGEPIFELENLQPTIVTDIKCYTKKIVESFEIDGTCYLDFRVRGNEAFFIELGTMYGLSHNSAVPLIANHYGISLRKLIMNDIIRGIKRRHNGYGR